MKKVPLVLIITIVLVSLSSCSGLWVNNHLRQYEQEFVIELPDKYDVLFFKSITNIDSVKTYMALKITSDDYQLSYVNQLTSDYSNYQTFNVFEKIALAKFYFANVINENEEAYFVDQLALYDWYGYEYMSTNRYNDLYVIHDLVENNMYLFYDVHQYPYDHFSHN